MELVHTKKQLHPESIGKKCFKNITIYILTFGLSKDSNHSTFSSWLQKELWNRQVKCSIGNIRESTHLMWAMHFDAFFILQGDNDFDPILLTKLAKFSKHIPMVRINTTEKAKKQIYNGVKMHSEYNIDLSIRDRANEQAINMLDILIA
ncbi:MAG TPA: hypothetical protein ENH52_03210 [Nitrospirae bacterium]|nr:hypothetical protein [Nitrospirota bacterium]